MALLPFPEWRPDITDLDTSASSNIKNVVPRGDGYGPSRSLLEFTSALAGACRGYCYARNADGSVTVFAATATKLYKLSNTDFTWADVSKGAGSYSAIATADQWQFRQFNNLLFATQVNAPLQVIDLTAPTAFADALGSPPQARYVAVVNRFLVLSGLLSNPYRVQWSGLNNVNAAASWDNVTLQSNFQDLPDGGIVRGVAGGEYGTIFQDASIRSMIFAPGNPVVFQIERISEDDGIFAPLSLVRAGDRIFFISPQGFKLLLPNGYPQPIGKERIDRTFFADVDASQPQFIIGANDVKANRVYWAYKSLAGTAGRFDKLVCYDWALKRFATLSVSGEYLASLAKPGLTLENLDAISASIDVLAFSLDDVNSTSYPQLSAASAAHKIGFFDGSNLEATLETAEQDGQGRRMFVRGIRPMTDASAALVSVGARDTAQATTTYGAETAINAQGVAPQRVDTRYARAKVRIPAGSTWSYCMGVEPDFKLTGKR